MSGMPPQHNTLTVAQESIKMGKETGDRTFKIMGMIMLAATGIGTLLHAAHMLWRDWRDERRHGRETNRSQPPPEVPGYPAVAEGDEPGPQRRWAHRPELASRTPPEDHA